MRYPKRHLSDYAIVAIPLGLFTVGLVWALSTIWPPEWKRRRDRRD